MSEAGAAFAGAEQPGSWIAAVGSLAIAAPVGPAPHRIDWI